MEYIIALLVFVLGSIIGSFLNVVALRYNTGTTVGGRSICFSCGKKLSWHELFPILSYVLQSGKCKTCKTKISVQYPIVEALSGLLFVAVFFKNAEIFTNGLHLSYSALFAAVYALIVFCILLVIAAYDMRHSIIPNGLVYTFSGLAFVQMFLSQAYTISFVMPDILTLLSGPIFFLLFASVWFFSRGKWIGLGDAKLALGIGWLLGFVAGGSALIFSFWAGAVIGIALVIASHIGKHLTSHKVHMKSEIPFAPYMIGATFFVYYTGITVHDFFAVINSVIAKWIW